MKKIIGALLLSAAIAGISYAGPTSTYGARDTITHAGSPPFPSKQWEARGVGGNIEQILTASVNKNSYVKLDFDLFKGIKGQPHIKAKDLAWSKNQDAPREEIKHEMRQQKDQLSKASLLQVKQADWSSYVYKSLGFIGQSCFRLASLFYRYSWR